MATSKYSDIEIQTAKNLLKEGYKWIARDESGCLFAYTDKPSKVGTYWWSVWYSDCTCDYVPIFQSVCFSDKEPTSLESIVHPQILDDAEKRYLSAVIRPFRKKIKYIVKMRYDKSEFIFMRVGTSSIYMPYFDIGTMYKGMEIAKKYTLEELGL